MMQYADESLGGEAACGRFGRRNYVDIHCHCLPGVDDGPAAMDESLALCQALVDDGVTVVIATPHQLGRFSECNEAALIREKVTALNEELRANDIALDVLPGGDVRVDERICQLLEGDKVLTLGDGGKYILLELPHQILIDIEPLLFELSTLGIRAVISHPERHAVLATQHNVLSRWLGHSIVLQITAGSLVGEFGHFAQNAAWQFLEGKTAVLVATDSHNTDDRRPRMKAAYEHIRIRLGEKIAELVCIENPLRLLKGDEVKAVSVYSQNAGK